MHKNKCKNLTLHEQSLFLSIVYPYLQARTASQAVEQFRTSVLLTLEQDVQTLSDAVFGTQGLQIKVAAVERSMLNGTMVGTVSR
jgi:hypothetical protein